MEDNLPQEEFYAPDAFSQAEQIAKEEGINFGASKPVTPEIVGAVTEIDLDVAQTLVELPFELASTITKINDLKLLSGESSRLGKLWKGPLQRLLGQYENSDIGIAAAATIVVALAKYEQYVLTVETRRKQFNNNSGNEGQGQNELHKTEGVKSNTTVHN